MFVDELTITAKAGNGGNGVVRWLREHSRPLGGPAGGNGGRGGDVYVRAVRDLGLLARYKGEKEFRAGDGEAGMSRSRYGRSGTDCTIDVPVGSIITDLKRGYRFELGEEGATEKILSGGAGGLGNEYFKSSTNRRPEQSTMGKEGEEGEFLIELELVVDVGLIGLPNAGKSSLLNALTNATSKVGAYPFTTVEPHLGDFYGFVLADIPGLIEGASEGKGLGYKFLRHIKRTKMLVHLVSLEESDPFAVYEQVRTELGKFDPEILKKKEIIVLTKSDLAPETARREVENIFTKKKLTTHTISILDDESIRNLSRVLSQALRGE